MEDARDDRLKSRPVLLPFICRHAALEKTSTCLCQTDPFILGCAPQFVHFYGIKPDGELFLDAFVNSHILYTGHFRVQCHRLAGGENRLRLGCA
jgi:hypothetical protein